MKLVLFAKRADYSYYVSLLYPELECPSSNESHSKKNWAFNKSVVDWLAILIHWRTQLKFKHCVVVWGTLVKLDFKQTIYKTLLLEIVFFVGQIRLAGSSFNHGFEKSW